MITVKEKACKGKGLARGEGCGTVGYHSSLKKSLCPSCWYKWLTDSESGRLYMNKITLSASKVVEHEKKKKKTKQKRDLLSVDAYRAKILQPVVNEIIRLIDFGQPCIASGVTRAKWSAGHFTSVGANRLIALNAHNIHIQSFHSNGKKGGQPIEYLQGLKTVYSLEYSDFILDLRKFKRQFRFNKSELEEAHKKAMIFRRHMKTHTRVITPLERIKKRNELNVFLGLYPDSVFPIK
jgi:hypothetical protein